MVSSLETILKFNFSNTFHKILLLPRFDKIMTIFWILGPFIYLIERDPADLWLTLISFIFLGKCIVEKNWGWLKQWWFIFCILLWLIGLLAGIIGPYKGYSFFQGFVWIRFPLYVAAAQVWLGRDRDVRIFMFISILLSMMIMFFILSAEMIIEPLDDLKNRLSWPYGDKMPGSYIAKVCLPAICILTFLSLNKFNFTTFFASIIVILSLFFVYKTGERTSFIILFFSILVVFVYQICITKFDFFNTSLIAGFTIIFFIIASFIFENVSPRFKHIANNIPVFDTSYSNAHWGAWRSGIQQGFENTLLGLGPSSTRYHCTKLGLSNPVIGNSFEKWYKNNNNTSFEQLLSGTEFLRSKKEFKNNFIHFFHKPKPEWLPGINYCGNHPHNFYIQIFAETGIVGLFFGICIYISLIIGCLKPSLIKNDCPLLITSFIIPFALLFPFQQSGSFYGQWGNLFIWFAIGFSISNINYLKK